MSREKQIDVIIDLLTEFDEMGFIPTTTVPNPEAYAVKWREELTKALIGYRKQSEGEWVDQHNGKYSNPIYVCSQCRKGTLLRPHINELDNMEMVQALSPFCPNCGAKMKGGAG